MLNGNPSHAGRTAFLNASPGVNLKSGSPFFAWVDYDEGAAQLSVYLASSMSKPATPLLTAMIDLSSQIPGDSMFVGVTSATGTAFSEQRVVQLFASDTAAHADGVCCDGDDDCAAPFSVCDVARHVAAVSGLRLTVLPPSQTPDAQTALAATDKPMPWLAKLPSTFAGSRMNRELAALAISRIARSDPSMAAERLGRIDSQLQNGEKNWAWGQIAWQAAQRHMPEALDWYRNIGDASLSNEVQEWKVRAALRVQDWGLVKSTIERMPSALVEHPTWIYWLGRAYRAAGRTSDADAQFARIAGQANFYGNLADEELGRSVVAPPKALAPTAAETAQMVDNPGIRRALALVRVNLRSEAVRRGPHATQQ